MQLASPEPNELPLSTRPAAKTHPRLDDTETIILVAATNRPDRVVLPVPGSITAPHDKVEVKLRRLLKRGLIEEAFAKLEDGRWRKDDEDRHITLRITTAGYEAIDLDPPDGLKPQPITDAPIKVSEKRSAKASNRPAARAKATAKREAATRTAPRKEPPKASKPTSLKPNKSEKLLTLLKRPTGATLAELMKSSGWQAHSVRGFLSAVAKKKLKLKLISEEDDKGVPPGSQPASGRQNLLDPPTQGTRSASEIHHLFPRAWLNDRGIREQRKINQVANLADVGWYDNSVIGSRGPIDYVPKVCQRLNINDDQWGRMCAEHALPIGWESMDYETFLSERRRRMAEIIRVAFRKLGGEPDSQPITPPWFLPGAEMVWQQIAEVERALRRIVREVYATTFGDKAAQRLEAALPEKDRENLSRALRSRPTGAEPLSIVDYLYIGQLSSLLFAQNVWQYAKARFGSDSSAKGRLDSAIRNIAPVRNEIAHVREVDRTRLLRASVACADTLKMLQDSSSQ